jgi:hypothetical protein
MRCKPINGIHFSSRFKIKTAFLNKSIKINVSSGDWCLEAIINGCFRIFSIPLIAYSTPHNKRSINNTTFTEQARKIVIMRAGKKSIGRAIEV